MHRDLLDALRCPHQHDESWLVAMVSRANGAHLIDADLACPVCGADFPVRNGVAWFGAPPRASGDQAIDTERLAALLSVNGGSRPILLTGAYTRAGAALATLIDVPQLWLDAPEDADRQVPLLSQLAGSARLPLGVDTMAAAAVDAPHGDAEFLGSIVRALSVGAHVVAPVSVVMPAELKALARDAHEWVAEVTTRASGLVELRRRG